MLSCVMRSLGMDYKVLERAPSFSHGGVVTWGRQPSAEIMGWKGISRVTATGDVAAHLLVPSQAVCGLCVSAARLYGVVGGCSCLPWSPGTDSVYCLGLRGRQAWYQGHPQVTLWRWYSKKPVCLWGQGSLALSKRDGKLIREAELYV